MNERHDQPNPNPQPALVPNKTAEAFPAPESLEDSGSRALSEALRSSFFFVKLLMVILVLAFFASGVFTVPSQQTAFILRFGRPVGTGEQQLLGPGLHWSFPYPIDEVVYIPSGQIQTVTSTTGWYATTPEMEAAGTEPFAGPTLNPATDGYALTADGNIIHVRANLQYRITDPLKYKLHFVDAASQVRSALNNALFHAAGKFTVDDALRLERARFEETVLNHVSDLVEKQELGVTVEQARLRIIPPRQVRQMFEQATAADLERRKLVDEAQGEANKILSRAQGEASQIINAGKTDASRIIKSVQAEAEYFQDQLPHYESNPSLFLARYQVDKLHQVLTNVQDIFPVMQRADGKPQQLWIQLNREPSKPTIKSDRR